KPAPPAPDSQFFRRLNLDMTGKIPTLLDIRDFIDDDRPDKRALWVERMMEAEDNNKTNLYAQHFAHVWRSLMLTNSNANFQAQQFTPGFELWLREKLQANTPYDKVARELLTTPPFNNRGGSSTQAFYFDNENKPENLASATTRVFLGVKLECAQCHPHPFAK